MSDEIQKMLDANEIEIGEFKPCVYSVPNMALTVMQLEDTTIVWRPWGPFKGHAVDLGYNSRGELVGIQIWDDVAKAEGPASRKSPQAKE